jgi:hypothetical protein
MQKESAWPGLWVRRRSGNGLRGSRHRTGRELAAADFQHGSDQIAHHVMQKSVAPHAINQQITRQLRSIPTKRWSGQRRALPASSDSFRVFHRDGIRSGIARSQAGKVVFAHDGPLQPAASLPDRASSGSGGHREPGTASKARRERCGIRKSWRQRSGGRGRSPAPFELPGRESPQEASG